MRGILMIEPLYHQTIAGKKTMTRRSGGLELVNENPDEWFLSISFTLNKTMEFDNPKAVKNCQLFLKKHNFQQVPWNEKIDQYIAKPRYKVGEVLYIKEPYGYIPVPPEPDKLIYRFDQNENNFTDRFMAGRKLWKNKLFMPADKARAFARITDIKCERLFDISDADCIAEGIQTEPTKGGIFDMMYKNYQGMQGWFLTPKQSFISLYKFANKIKYASEIPNIWVWAYTYEYLPNYKIDGQT